MAPSPPPFLQVQSEEETEPCGGSWRQNQRPRARPRDPSELCNVTGRVTIQNKLGLHARPAMLFVETASTFAADIVVRRTDQRETVDGKSIMQLMMLAANFGTEIEIIATGADAKAAIETLTALVNSTFQED